MSKTKGFSAVEVLIILAILGVLAAIIIGAVASARTAPAPGIWIGPDGCLYTVHADREIHTRTVYDTTRVGDITINTPRQEKYTVVIYRATRNKGVTCKPEAFAVFPVEGN